MSKPVIFVIGGPGSGKGTQCEKIVKKYGFTHLSTGDLLREEVASGSDLGKQLNEIMKSGQLVSNNEVLALLESAIKRKSDQSNGFLIDGYPREIEQGLRFEADVSPCSLILYFECSDDVMTKRLIARGLSSGRVDDNAETIKTRLSTFHSHAQPILRHYKEKVVILSGERDINDIFNDISKTLDSLIKTC